MKIHCKEKLNRFSKYKFLEDYFLKKLPATFYENGRIQCGKSRQRTFDDLFDLTKTYFKTATKPQVASILRKLCIKYNSEVHNMQGIGAQYCSDIHDDVFYNKMDRWKYRQICGLNNDTSIYDYTYNKRNKTSIFKIIELADRHDKK